RSGEPASSRTARRALTRSRSLAEPTAPATRTAARRSSPPSAAPINCTSFFRVASAIPAPFGEIRNPKLEIRNKSQTRRRKYETDALVFRAFFFGIRICFGFRISVFGFSAMPSPQFVAQAGGGLV